MGYANAGKGLKTMFAAEIGMIICMVIMIIPIIGPILGGIGAIVFSILSIYGLSVAGRDIEGLKNAFTLTIANIIISILAFIPFISAGLKMLNSLVGLLITYFVCNSLKNVLSGMGKESIASLGQTVWTLTLVFTVLDIILSVIALIPIIGILAKVLLVFVGIGSFIAGIMYLVYLYKCSNAF